MSLVSIITINEDSNKDIFKKDFCDKLWDIFDYIKNNKPHLTIEKTFSQNKKYLGWNIIVRIDNELFQKDGKTNDELSKEYNRIMLKIIERIECEKIVIDNIDNMYSLREKIINGNVEKIKRRKLSFKRKRIQVLKNNLINYKKIKNKIIIVPVKDFKKIFKLNNKNIIPKM
ncbi:MAG: hypothetical protein ACRC4M_04840 [Mycoplasma sp.]